MWDFFHCKAQCIFEFVSFKIMNHFCFHNNEKQNPAGPLASPRWNQSSVGTWMQGLLQGVKFYAWLRDGSVRSNSRGWLVLRSTELNRNGWIWADARSWSQLLWYSHWACDISWFNNNRTRNWALPEESSAQVHTEHMVQALLLAAFFLWV